MPERFETYAAALFTEWHAGRTGRPYALAAATDGEVPVFVANAVGAAPLAVAVAPLWEPESDVVAEEHRIAMEERLSAGLVRGPFLLWVPPRAAVPAEEPEASEFVQRVQQAAGPLLPGGRAEVLLPVPVQVAKLRDEGGYASVIGGLSRWWTLITERVNGTVHVNAARIRRAPQSSATREALFDRIGELARGLETGQAVEFDASEAWTVQRLREEPLGVAGFAVVQAPPQADPAEGSLMRRVLRKRLRAARAALASVDAEVKAVALPAIYDYAEHENVGAFVKSLDPSLFAGLGAVVAVVDGEVRPILQLR
ncbi:MAG: hypothetical protein WEC75_07780 [Dehalococcoidia bacterium]